MNTSFLKKTREMLCVSLVIGGAAVNAPGSVAYLTSGEYIPWAIEHSDPGSNETAMDRVFGIAGWDNLSFENADASVLFSSAYTFIFLEGGDHATFALGTFLADNGNLIENWVRNGGRLLVNAAPNEGDGMDLGFGLTLNYNNDTSSTNAYAVDVNHPIVDGNYGNAGSTFIGDFFAHATVSGDGLNSLIVGDAGVVLGELSFDEGFVLVGGMTPAHFHYDTSSGIEVAPQEAYDLRANIIDYIAHGIIPEPSTYALWGAVGLLGVVIARRRCGK